MVKRLLIVIVVIIAATVAITFTAGASKKTTAFSPQAQTAPPSHTAEAPTGTTGHDARDGGQVVTTGLFRSIAKRENPIVVAITTESRVKAPDMSQFFGNGQNGGQNGGDENNFLQRFFGMQPPQQREQTEHALGSGFIITPDGEILTNNHVVSGAQQIRVALFSDERRTYDADVVGRDPLTDTALIKLKNGPANLPTAALGDSDAMQPGDWVMAIGNPFRLGHTVTVGVISYKGRQLPAPGDRLEDMLQTDASINPGNSGGPLIDTDGEVIGINAAILASDEGGGGNVGIGFAVPINT
ncbi:MAG: S1C family serine protease, partial [Vicinamibacterales bacterium]